MLWTQPTVEVNTYMSVQKASTVIILATLFITMYSLQVTSKLIASNYVTSLPGNQSPHNKPSSPHAPPADPPPHLMSPSCHHHHHQSLNREGHCGTTDDFATSCLHLSQFSTALWDLPNSRPVHTLTLFSHLFLYLAFHFVWVNSNKLFQTIVNKTTCIC